MSIDDHDRFRADVRQRLRATEGEPDPSEVVEEIHAELLERLPQRRSQRGVKRVLSILDELNREGGT